MGIGTIGTIVINVNDLEAGEKFWSEMTGLEVISRAYARRFSFLGLSDPWKVEITLQRVEAEKGTDPNRVHLDIDVEGPLDEAIRKVEVIGGLIKKAPSLYPRPGSVEDLAPVADWAVMQDPFGNEFCLIAPITRDQSDAAVATWEKGESDDHALRLAAGVTPA